jgi:hypothetical protein
VVHRVEASLAAGGVIRLDLGAMLGHQEAEGLAATAAELLNLPARRADGRTKS